MKFFVGTYENKIDAKGRVSLPAPFRDIVTQGNATAFYIFRSPTENALEAGGVELMEMIANSIEQQADMFSPEEDILSYIMQSARLVTCDSTGRFIMPPEFIEFANFDATATFVGYSRRFQIWNTKAYAEKSKDARQRFKESKLTLKSKMDKKI